VTDEGGGDEPRAAGDENALSHARSLDVRLVGERLLGSAAQRVREQLPP
jgi:hypothetical protein